VKLENDLGVSSNMPRKNLSRLRQGFRGSSRTCFFRMRLLHAWKLAETAVAATVQDFATGEKREMVALEHGSPGHGRREVGLSDE